MEEIFKGLKVLELASILAGPLVGSFFAELGAEVIKIENKKSNGDSTRQWKSSGDDDEGVSSYYASANMFKKSILLDYTDKDDFILYESFVKDADVIITNYQKATAERLHISIDKIRATNQNAVIAQLNAYEYDDPRPGFDMVMQAETGFISMSGTSEGEYTKMPVAMVDVLAAHQMKEAVLIGLLKKEREGKGSIIHVSLYKSAVSALVNQGSSFLMTGHVPRPMGMLHPTIAPYGEVVETADGKSIILAIGSDGQFEKLAKIINFDKELLNDFKINKQRVIHRNRLNVVLQERFSDYKSTFILGELKKGNIPFARIKDLSQVFNEPLAKEMIVEYEIEGRLCRSVSNISFTSQY